MSRRILWIPILIVAFGLDASAAEPTVRLSEDGTTFLYRSQPGDQPGVVAAWFGVSPSDRESFFAANGITDPTRVAVGHVYRISNPLAARAAEAEARAVALTAEADTARSEARTLRAESEKNAARATELEGRAASLERLARLWPWMQLLGIVLVLALAGAGWVAYQSTVTLGEAERYARGLAEDVDERRRAALAERQQAARRILDLEEAIRSLEHERHSAASIRRPTGTH